MTECSKCQSLRSFLLWSFWGGADIELCFSCFNISAFKQVFEGNVATQIMRLLRLKKTFKMMKCSHQTQELFLSSIGDEAQIRG